MVLLKVYGGVLVDAGSRWHVCLEAPDGSRRSAYIAKDRVRKFYYRFGPEQFGYGASYFVEYESDSPFYASLAWDSLPDGAQEVGIEKFNVNPKWLKPSGRSGYYRVWLGEMDAWDKYDWPLCVAIEIKMTNVHPYYGVMD